MRIITGLIALQFALNITAQTLPGYVTIQNTGKAAGKSRPESAYPASVVAKGATDAYVDPDSGKFDLVFDDKKPGQDVEINVVKPDYEVVNYEDLQTRLPEKSSNAPPLRIYLCPQGEWRRHADAYYATNQRVVSDNYDRLIRAAEQQLATAGKANRALADSVNRLIRERDEALVLLKGYVDRFARVNLDDVTDRYRAAFRYFAAGQLDSFLLAANEKAIRADLARVEAEIKRAKALGLAGRDKVAAGEALRQQTLEELLIRARALVLTGRWDEADRTLGIAASEDSTNQKVQMEYYDFKKNRLQHKEALQIAEKMLQRANNLQDTLHWLDRTATIYLRLSEYDRALKSFEMEMDLLKKNNLRNLFLEAYANILQGMASIYNAKGDYKKAEQLADESLSIMERAARVTKQAAQYFPDQLVDLANCYMQFANYPKAEATFLRAWEVKRKAVDTTTLEYQDWCAGLKENLAAVYDRIPNRTEQTISLARELMEYWAGQAKRDPQSYTIRHVNAMINLEVSLAKAGNLIEAERYLTLADSLLEHGPIPPGVENLKARIKSNWGSLHVVLGRKNAAMSCAEACLNIYRDLIQRDTLAFGDGLLSAYRDLININSDEKKAAELYQEYLSLARVLHQKQPQKYTETLAEALRTGGGTWLPVNKRDSTLIKEAEVLYQQLALENPDKFAERLASCQLGLGSIAKLSHDTTNAIRYYEKAFTKLSAFSASKQGPTGNPVLLVEAHMSLGNMYYNRDPVRADLYFREGLAIAQRAALIQTPMATLYLCSYGTFKSNYGTLTEAIALLEECKTCFQNLLKDEAGFYSMFQAVNLQTLGNLYLLDNDFQKSLSAHQKSVQTNSEDAPTEKATKQQISRLFNLMEADETDSLVSGLDQLLADKSFAIFNYPAIYHFGTYLLAADRLSKAKKCFRHLNGHYQALLDKAGAFNPFGNLHTHIMSSLSAASAAQVAALQYTQTQDDARQKEALDLLDAAEKSLRSVPASTPGRAMVAARIAEARAELKN